MDQDGGHNKGRAYSGAESASGLQRSKFQEILRKQLSYCLKHVNSKLSYVLHVKKRGLQRGTSNSVINVQWEAPQKVIKNCN